MTRAEYEKGSDYCLQRAREESAAGNLGDALRFIDIAIWWAERAAP